MENIDEALEALSAALETAQTAAESLGLLAAAEDIDALHEQLMSDVHATD